MADRCRSPGYRDSHREETCWHTTFGNIHVKAKSSLKHLKVANTNPSGRQRYPVELITIEAVVKKDELQHLALLCKSEIDSMGRITAGVLRTLKLEGSVGSAAISQLSNLGGGSLDNIFTPEKLSQSSSPSCDMTGGQSSCLESTVASLEEAVLDTQTKCAALANEWPSSQSSTEYIGDVKQLSEKLESTHKLLNQLRTQL